MSEPGPLCERCGQPARVHITSEVTQDGGMRHLCLSCADQIDAAIHSRERRLNHGAILMSVGAFTLMLSLAADWIGVGRSQGFGWKQDAVLVAGLVLLGAGALIRAMTVLVIGGMVTVIALVADWIGLGGEEGFGLKQVLGAAVGLLMLASGIARARSSRPTNSHA